MPNVSDHHIFAAYIVCLLIFGAGIGYFCWNSRFRSAHRKPARPIERRHLQLEQLRRLPASPLHSVRPGADLSVEVFLNNLDAYCQDIFDTFLVGNTANVVVQGITLATSRSDIIYQFSNEAMDLYRQGKATIPIHEASGKFLPYMQDQAGKIIEQAKGCASMLPKLAQIFSIIVGAAHIIAGLDLSRRIAKLQLGVDFLVVGRTIDKESRLYRLFIEAQGQLKRELTDARLDRLFEIRYDLLELRENWGREIKQLLMSAEQLPARHSVHPSSWYRRGKRERQVLEQTISIERKIEASSVALLIDAMLAMSTGTMEDFREGALERDLQVWEGLSLGFSKALVKFRRAKPHASFAHLVVSVNFHSALIDGFQGAGKGLERSLLEL
jgi:hypothetical protein